MPTRRAKVLQLSQPLLADQTFTAVGTFVDGDIAAAAGRRDGDRDTAGLVAAAERGLAAGGGCSRPAGRPR